MVLIVNEVQKFIKIKSPKEIMSQISVMCFSKIIISFYLADDNISIYEPAQKNSGIIEGKFLHKRKYKNVDKNMAFITPTDMAIGGDVKINGHSFHILSADDYTTNYLNQYLV